MDVLDIARWQFGITTVYHFLFVPITIGLSFLVAGFQTAWYRTNKPEYLRLTRFFGKLFLINFAMGIVTGIVQEFQFGMNWSDYSRFVGDIFGAPLAIEGLVAFFLESTFLGLWIFGWDRLPRRIHLATIWIAAVGTVLSAYFILAANSWMQHPVGYTINPESGRAELTDFMAVMTNSTNLITFPHTIAACFLTGGALVAGVAFWHIVRGNEVATFKKAARAGAWTTLVAAIAVMATGDIQGKVMTDQQPMKMAAAEAIYDTTDKASFSLITIGTPDGQHEMWSIRIPGLASWLAEGDYNAEVEGINDIKREYEAEYGPGNYTPIIPVTYWTFRLMIGFGALAGIGAAAILWFIRGDKRPRSKWFARAALTMPLLPLLANSSGWIFTEMGRQPWVVFGEMQTAAGVSPSVSTGEALTTLIGFTALYGILAVIEVGLLMKYAKVLPPADEPTPASDAKSDTPLAFAY